MGILHYKAAQLLQHGMIFAISKIDSFVQTENQLLEKDNGFTENSRAQRGWI